MELLPTLQSEFAQKNAFLEAMFHHGTNQLIRLPERNLLSHEIVGHISVDLAEFAEACPSFI